MVPRQITIISTALMLACSSVFAAPDLLLVVKSSLNYDPSYLSTVQTNNSTIAAVGISRAALLPSLSGTVSKSWYWSKQITNNVSATSVSKAKTVGLSLTQSIFNFSDYKSLAAAKVGAIAAMLSTKSAYQSLLQGVASDYFSLASAQKVLELDKQQVVINQKLVNLATSQFKAGSTLYSDVLTAKAAYLSAKQAVISQRQALVSARNALSEHIPTSPNNVREIVGHLTPIKPKHSALKRWIQKALQINPSVLEKKWDVLASRKSLQAEKASLLPNLSGSYSYSKSDSSYGGQTYVALPSSQSSSNSFSLTLNVPLYQGGQVYATIKQDTYNYMAAKDTYNEEKKTVESNVSTNYQSLRLEADNITSLKQSVEMYEKNYAAMVKAYAAGKETMSDVQNALSSLHSQRSSLAQAEYTFLTDYVTFKQFVGNLRMTDIQAINNWMHKHVQS